MTSITASEYQAHVERTMGNEDEIDLGLATEVGEVLSLVKGRKFHGKEVPRDHMLKELGDLQWYVAAKCKTEGFTLDEVMRANVHKLQVRYPDGFSVEASLNRTPEDE